MVTLTELSQQRAKLQEARNALIQRIQATNVDPYIRGRQKSTIISLAQKDIGIIDAQLARIGSEEQVLKGQITREQAEAGIARVEGNISASQRSKGFLAEQQVRRRQQGAQQVINPKTGRVETTSTGLGEEPSNITKSQRSILEGLFGTRTREIVAGQPTRIREERPASFQRREPQPSRLPGSVEPDTRKATIYNFELTRKGARKFQADLKTYEQSERKRLLTERVKRGKQSSRLPGSLQELIVTEGIYASPDFKKKLEERRKLEAQAAPIGFKAILVARDVIEKGKSELRTRGIRTVKEYGEFYGEFTRGTTKLTKTLLFADTKKEFKKTFTDPEVQSAAITLAVIPISAGAGAVIGSGLRLGARMVTASETLLRIAASKPVQASLKVASTGLDIAFFGSEAVRIVSSEKPGRAIVTLPLDVAGFNLATNIERRTLASELARKTRFGAPIEEIAREVEISRQAEKEIIKGGIEDFRAAQLKTLTKIQRTLRVTAKQPVPRKLLPEELPEFLSIQERGVILKVIKKEPGEVFGSLSTQLAFEEGAVRKAGDIDYAVANEQAKKKLNVELVKELSKGKNQRLEVKKESIGFEGEKIIDIKAQQRLGEFPFRERSIPLENGLTTTRQTEQLGRKIGGYLDVSRRSAKGTKDIDDALRIAELLLKKQLSKSSSISKSQRSRLLNLQKELSVNVKRGKASEEYILYGGVPKASRFKSKILLSNQKIPSASINRPSEIKESKIRPSSIRSSSFLLSRFKSSKIPVSKLPPSRIPTVIPLSKTPTSKLPPSRIPSRLPPSRLPPSIIPPSKVPLSKVPPSQLPPSRIPPRSPPRPPRIPRQTTTTKIKLPDFNADLRKKKQYRLAPARRRFITSLIGLEAGLTVRKTPKRLYTGLEARPYVVKARKKRKR